MPSASRLLLPARRVIGIIVATLVLSSLATFAPAAAAAQPTREPAGPRRSEAHRLDRAEIRRGDRAALADLPARTRIAYHPETGRVRYLAGTADAPLSSAPASLAARQGRAGKRDLEAAAARFLRGH